MTQPPKEVSKAADTNIDKPEQSDLEFTEKLLRLNVIACSTLNRENLDVKEAVKDCRGGLKALGATQGLQEMLAAQMLAVHELQQVSMAMASRAESTPLRQYFTNTSIKLANTFVQQASLLAKLQGNGGQKIIVEHVDVHNGGQAVVGVVNTPANPTHEVKK